MNKYKIEIPDGWEVSYEEQSELRHDIPEGVEGDARLVCHIVLRRLPAPPATLRDALETCLSDLDWAQRTVAHMNFQASILKARAALAAEPAAECGCGPCEYRRFPFGPRIRCEEFRSDHDGDTHDWQGDSSGCAVHGKAAECACFAYMGDSSACPLHAEAGR